MTRRTGRLSALLLLAFVLGGCSLVFRSPGVEIADVRLVQMGFTAGTAEVTLEVSNPNFFSLEVREFRYLLEVAEAGDRWAELAQGASLDTVRIRRRGTQEVTLAVPFQYRAAGTAIRAWWETGAIHYRLRGEVKARAPARTVDLPFRSEGTLTP